MAMLLATHPAATVASAEEGEMLGEVRSGVLVLVISVMVLFWLFSPVMVVSVGGAL